LNGLAGPPSASNAFLAGLAPVAPPKPVYRSFEADGITYDFCVLALKVNATGVRTDLVFAGMRDEFDLRGLVGLVLTEWKVGDDANAVSRFEEAYASGKSPLRRRRRPRTRRRCSRGKGGKRRP